VGGGREMGYEHLVGPIRLHIAKIFVSRYPERITSPAKFERSASFVEWTNNCHHTAISSVCIEL
jgi:hypothetical protein